MTYSSHYLRDGLLRSAIARALDREREVVAQQLVMLSEIASPYKA